jgi:DNA-binding XRE family transcriptional regulator
MTPEQGKMARAGIGLGVRELASAAGITPETVVLLEKSETLRLRTLEAIRAALESAGAVFIPAGSYQGDAGPGVRLRTDNDKGSTP